MDTDSEEELFQTIPSTPKEKMLKICYYRDEPLLPVYETGKSKPFPTRVFAEHVVNGDIHGDLIAKLVPHQPTDNLTFFIGLDYLDHWKDILCDNLGVWAANGTKSLYYSSRLNRNGKITLIASKEEDACIKCTRYLFAYPSCKQFKRIVIKITSKNTNTVVVDWTNLSPILLQYYFEGEKETIVVPSHGNSKKSVPFFRTKESTKLAIKKKIDPLASTDICHTKRLFGDMLQEKGGVEKIRSPADIPRNREQIRNFHKAKNVDKEDDLTTIIFKCKEESKSHNPFIREVIAAPELEVFLTTDQQLKDIYRFCCNEVNAGILGVDMTFNIGEYYVTVTSD